MINLLAKLKPIFWLFLSLSIIGLFLGFFFLYTKVNDLTESVDALSPGPEIEVQNVGETSEPAPLTQSCGEDCRKEIEKAVSEAIAAIPVTSERVVEKQTVVTEQQGGTTYIPLGTTGSTTTTDWADIVDSAVYVDVENDYGAGAKVSWEAFLKVAHGNGKVFARLYDDTNKIAVDFSELSTENNATFEQVGSPNLPMWRGRNLYKVQIKSLNSFEVTYSGGKLKVDY